VRTMFYPALAGVGATDRRAGTEVGRMRRIMLFATVALVMANAVPAFAARALFQCYMSQGVSIGPGGKERWAK
jgi:hypothetical protein